MVVNPSHYQRLLVKQTMDVENTLLDVDNIIDFPIKKVDLSSYDEMMEMLDGEVSDHEVSDREVSYE